MNFRNLIRFSPQRSMGEVSLVQPDFGYGQPQLCHRKILSSRVSDVMDSHAGRGGSENLSSFLSSSSVGLMISKYERLLDRSMMFTFGSINIPSNIVFLRFFLNSSCFFFSILFSLLQFSRNFSYSCILFNIFFFLTSLESFLGPHTSAYSPLIKASCSLQC